MLQDNGEVSKKSPGTANVKKRKMKYKMINYDEKKERTPNAFW